MNGDNFDGNRSFYSTDNTQVVDINEELNRVLFEISDALFSKKLTISDVLNQNFIAKKNKTFTNIPVVILDKTIDGKEYQLIQRQNFYDSLEAVGIVLDLEKKIPLKTIFQPILGDFIDIQNIVSVFHNLGIWEDISTSTKAMDFTKLTGSAIRLFNKVSFKYP